MSEGKRPLMIPVACFCHDDKGYVIDFELPGVDKEHIDVEVSDQGLCVAGSRDDAEFAGCWVLAHEIDEDKAQANYSNGLLRVRLPFKEPVACKKVIIE